MLNVLAVFVGGGIGSTFRYLVNLLYNRYCAMPLPLATFGVNVISSFLIGCLMAYILSLNINSVYKCLFVVGFCGGFSTLSALSFEVFEMFRHGQILLAIFYVVLSFVVCIVMTALGYYWTRYYV